MAEELLSMQKVNKYFPGVHALNDVDFSCNRGEVHALVGHNGAGKSTLIKVLGGVYHADSGEIYLRGKRFAPVNPAHGTLAGISIIHQEFNLMPDLTVAKNIYLARELKTRLGFVDYRLMNRKAQEILNRLEVRDISPLDYIRDLSVDQMQIVEIAKALSVKAEIIVMDEPTAALPLPDVKKLFNMIRKMKTGGMTIIYISHRMEDIFQIADRVTLMKDGMMLATLPIKGLDHRMLVERMTGRAIGEFFPQREKYTSGRKRALEVKDFMSSRMSEPVRFEVLEGEIFGITGLEGCGATELSRGLYGVDKPIQGEILLRGEKVKIGSPRQGLFNDFAYLTKDRRKEGLILRTSLTENISIPSRVKHHKGGFLNLKQELALVEEYVKKLNIRAGGLSVEVKDLSGGNQQKVVLAKWLATQCRVLIVDEPTRGVDVESKAELYVLMRELVKQNVIVIVLSSDMEEVLGLCDRLLVLHQGEIKAEMNWEKVTEDAILLAATGVKLDAQGSPVEKMKL